MLHNQRDLVLPRDAYLLPSPVPRFDTSRRRAGRVREEGGDDLDPVSPTPGRPAGPCSGGDLARDRTGNSRHIGLTRQVFPHNKLEVGDAKIATLRERKVGAVCTWRIQKSRVRPQHFRIFYEAVGLEWAQLSRISSISDMISRCPRLKTLRLEENCLQLSAIHSSILADSKVSILALDGNLFDKKNLADTEGFDKYMDSLPIISNAKMKLKIMMKQLMNKFQQNTQIPEDQENDEDDIPKQIHSSNTNTFQFDVFSYELFTPSQKKACFGITGLYLSSVLQRGRKNFFFIIFIIVLISVFSQYSGPKRIHSSLQSSRECTSTRDSND
uniref:Uncharacterized protein n=1 Tax=Timema genevievae TaxID=629358 RepID=A0A7R9PHU8_TIMGE|nr:unnamed protein product [Timema genevievae]